eukprot:4368081-Prymnesium_polylepis.1
MDDVPRSVPGCCPGGGCLSVLSGFRLVLAQTELAHTAQNGSVRSQNSGELSGGVLRRFQGTELTL